MRAGHCDLRPGISLPQTAPITFDVSIWQMLSPLTVGASVCVLDERVVSDPTEMAQSIIREGFEYIELVPSFIGVFLDYLCGAERVLESLKSSLRAVISTGEVLGAALAERWIRSTGIPLINAYGPAECTDDVTQGNVSFEIDRTAAAPVGKPLPNCRIYVLDEDLQPMAPGMIGEIYIGGSNVGRGYFNDASLTAAAFIPDPYSKVVGSRMYRTGDLGRWRLDGMLECLGRRDNQIKLHGRRIELGDVRSAPLLLDIRL